MFLSSFSISFCFSFIPYIFPLVSLSFFSFIPSFFLKSLFLFFFHVFLFLPLVSLSVSSFIPLFFPSVSLSLCMSVCLSFLLSFFISSLHNACFFYFICTCLVTCWINDTEYVIVLIFPGDKVTVFAVTKQLIDELP